MSTITDYLDQLLGKITMYRQLVYALLTIATMAFILMLTGYLPYSPVLFLVSLVLFVGVSYGSNRLFGWLFGVQPHGESAIITGLILALLFSPPTTLLIGFKLALVAAIAMASKYIIAIRSRHIFNPAAIAIVIASVSKLAFATWWIATPALLPVTLIVAFLVLYKTKRIQMALVFLVVATTGIALQTIAQGSITPQTFVSALTSWPLIFFAGIMLCEPLTLPPRRYQQFVVVGLVATLLVSSFHYGPISMTPALALIVGNAVAWLWATRGVIKLRLASKNQMSSTLYDFTFDSNSKMKFTPGQYLELTLPHRHSDSRGTRRVFSIVGSVGSDQVSIGTRIPDHSSSFKRSLMALKNGQTVYATRVAGDFVLPKDESIPIVLIAGGIGITPYISHIVAGGKRRITLIYAAGSVSDLAYVHELKKYDIDITVVTTDTTPLPDKSWRHVAAGPLTKDILNDLIHKEENPVVYISGPPGMVNATKRIVKELGLPAKTDHFTGY
jgi:glycine betaine catabolism B